ncbi:MAG: hypothetical protein IJT58_01770 [Synergistaceae bacterium]|nr:hypothetical protein [Synergistaceae bacterium]
MPGVRPYFKIRQTVNNSIIIGIIAGALGILSGIRKLDLIMTACSIIGLLGVYLTVKRRKSGAFVFMFAALLSVVMRFTDSLSITYPVLGLCYSIASMNNFSLINLGAPAFQGNEDISDVKNMQQTWLKKVNEFISSYSVFAYYGYLFIILACLALSGVWLFAPEIISGHSREYWALLGSGVLVALAGFTTEMMRRKS